MHHPGVMHDVLICPYIQAHGFCAELSFCVHFHSLGVSCERQGMSWSSCQHRCTCKVMLDHGHCAHLDVRVRRSAGGWGRSSHCCKALCERPPSHLAPSSAHGCQVPPMNHRGLPMGPEHAWEVVSGAHPMGSHGHQVCPRTTYLLPMGSEHAWEEVSGAHPMDTADSHGHQACPRRTIEARTCCPCGPGAASRVLSS